MLMLPKSFVFNLAQDSIEIKDGILYQTRKDGSLSRSESLEYLEKLYKEEYAEEIDNFQTKNIQNYMDKNIKNKRLNLKAIQEQLTKSKANMIIFREIIPRISGESLLGNINLEVKQDTDKPADVTKYAEYQEYEDTKKKYETRATLKNPKFHKTTDHSIMGRYVLSGFDVKIKNGRICNGSLLMSIDDAEKRFQEILQKELLVESVKNISKRNNELARMEGQEEALKRILERESFSGKRGGFMKRGAKTYIFWMNFPSFINKFPSNGRYYKFPAGKIKIDAIYDSEDFEPMHLTIRSEGDYIHPYTDYKLNKDGDRLMCTDEKVDEIKEESGKGWAKMIEMLLVGKKTMMSSFNSRMYNEKDWYRKHNYNRFEISESDARNGKTPITNINIIGG